MHDSSATCSLQAEHVVPHLRTQLTGALVQASQAIPAPVPASSAPHPRGRPVRLPAAQRWLGLLWCLLEGMNHYEQLRRWLASHAVGGFAPLLISSDAIVKRLLQAGLAPVETLFTLFEQWLPSLPPTCDLAPFASHIVALDETTLDAVTRHLSWQRQHPKGSAALLAGKLAGLFDIRHQRWLRLQYFANAVQNCKVGLLTRLSDLPWHSLLLFDLGYFSFPCFDYLTERGDWWISRLREKTGYQLLHVHDRHQGILDALVWLGSGHGARAGRAVRLVRFHDGHSLRCYLTNVLDPHQLPMEQIARLYARRWDIELALLTLKDLLGLHHWWSSQLPLILQQIALVLLLAHLWQTLRLQIAAEAGCDPFDVSLPLLVQYVPQLIRDGHHPIDWVLTYGKPLGFIRPHSRLQVTAPHIPPEQLVLPPASLGLVRKARYLTYSPRPGRPSYNKKQKARPSASPSPPPP